MLGLYYDYRDKIKVKRAYAGAKGIGRFSCDRLGKILTLESIKDEPNPKLEILITDWEKFEEDLKDEFVNISVLHETIEPSVDSQSGTTLEITGLKSRWDREKLLKLKESLARLINPNSVNEDDVFEIYLQVEEEILNDLKQVEKNKKRINSIRKPLDESQVEYFRVVNGQIRNLIFDILSIRTSYIESVVKHDSITTTLYEAGQFVYTIEEKNPFSNFSNLKYSIYFLNQSAKLTFTKRMGIEPVNYGHIFVYKNGLRIFPYGERGEDPLKMDNRKAQGYSRYLGTREVIGYISIYGDNGNLRETSSRGDGFIKTETYYHLENWFYETLKKLERYSLEITDWGNFLSEDEFINLNETIIKNSGTLNERIFDVNQNLQKLIKNLTRGSNVVGFSLSDKILDIIERKSEGSAKTILSHITNEILTENFNKDEVIENIKSVEKKLLNLQKSKEEAEKEAFDKLIENERLSKELTEEIATKLFDVSITNRDKEDLLTLQHQIVHTASNITFSLDELVKLIDQDIPKEKLIEEITSINLEVQKILSASRFVTNAGFNVETEKITEDIVQFIYYYVVNNYIPINTFIHQKKPIDIYFKEPSLTDKKIIKFRPLEITVIFDNLFNNSKKAQSTKILLEWKRYEQNIVLSFRDNGNGIPKEIEDKIFDFGYTKTNGSGIGLFQAREIMKKLGGSISVNTNIEKGVEFLIEFPL